MKLSQLVIALLLLLPLPASAAVRVVATLPSLAAIARELGGADATVESMLPPNIDPHFADAKPSLVVTLSRADLLVENGLELEVGWLPALVQQSRNAKLAPGANGRFDASTVVRRLEVPRGAVDRAQGDVHPGGNPHFLYDPRAGAAIARALATRLASIDPTHAAGYQSRAAAMATLQSMLSLASFFTLNDTTTAPDAGKKPAPSPTEGSRGQPATTPTRSPSRRRQRTAHQREPSQGLAAKHRPRTSEHLLGRYHFGREHRLRCAARQD
jgi:hypothetical protein